SKKCSNKGNSSVLRSKTISPLSSLGISRTSRVGFERMNQSVILVGFERMNQSAILGDIFFSAILSDIFFFVILSERSESKDLDIVRRC
ncbi:MAG: hypothetical protein KJ864_03775, partial [Candidatus Omnitrophica bacterium]|nr:hypothetical protein [Candidatus Omnitrophota bacterium]